MVFPKKKLRLNMVFLVLLGKMIFNFPGNMILHLRRKMKDDLSWKIHGNMIFSSDFWKDGLSKKDGAGTWSFLHYLERWYFFPRKHDLFSSGRKWKTAFSRKYMETWCIAQRRKAGNLIYRIEAWLLLKFIWLGMFYHE